MTPIPSFFVEEKDGLEQWELLPVLLGDLYRVGAGNPADILGLSEEFLVQRIEE